MNIVVVAGAGAGKTYALVQDYISSLFGFNEAKERYHPSQILAVTFTEKAAQEMRTRVIMQLLKMAREDKFEDWMIEKALAFKVNLPSSLELRLMSKWLLSAPICTFHSFCSQIIRDYSLDANMDSEFSLLAPLDESEIALDIAELVILDALNEGIPHVDQLVTRFKLHKVGEVKGLCDNLVSLNNHLAEHGISALEIKNQFVKKDVNLFEDHIFKGHLEQIKDSLLEFRNSKVTQKVKEKLENIEISFNRFLSLLKEDDDGLEISISAGFKDLRSQVKGRFGNDELRKSLVSAIVSLGSYLCSYFTRKDAEVISLLLERFSEKLEIHKRNFSEVGFSDLLSLARNMLRYNLKVRQSVKDRFNRVLVDEFQDTSPVQEDLIALICEDKHILTPLTLGERAMSKVPLEKDMLFVVGDPKQSIYGFRGADVSLFQHTLEVVTKGTSLNKPTGEKKSLILCRRSQGAVVELVNLIGRATLSIPEEGVHFGDDDCLSALKPAKEQAGAIWKADISSLQDKENVMACVLAKQINQLVSEQETNWSDVVILVRRIKAATPIMMALQKLNIPVRIFGGEGFYSRIEVMDILAALKLAVDDNDEIASLTVLRSPLVGVSDANLVDILDGINEWKGGIFFSQIASEIKGLSIGEDVKKRILGFQDLLLSIRNQLGILSVANAIDMLLNEGKYALAMAVEDDADDRLANVLKLRAMCIGFICDGALHIRQLWDRLDNPPKESLAESLDAKSNTVRIMTIHQSKGLEFNYVVLADVLSTDPNETDEIGFHHKVGLAVTHKGRPISVCAPQTSEEKQLAPTDMDLIRQKKKRASQFELARLLYVALTRAKEKIFFLDVQVDGENTIDRGVNLRRLFYAGKQINAARFNELMPPVLIKPESEMQNRAVSLQKIDYVLPPQLVMQPKLKMRVFASQIGTFKEDGLLFSSPTEKSDKPNAKKIGSIAHRLLACVGMYLHKEISSSEVDLLLKAAVNQLGIGLKDDESELNSLLDACQRTLLGPILSLLKEGYLLQFEVPIFLELKTSVLEGFADLVSISSSKCIVIDFKSSYFAAKSNSTKEQLFAYTEALKPRLNMPIYTSVCVIGDDKLIFL